MKLILISLFTLCVFAKGRPLFSQKEKSEVVYYKSNKYLIMKLNDKLIDKGKRVFKVAMKAYSKNAKDALRSEAKLLYKKDEDKLNQRTFDWFLEEN